METDRLHRFHFSTAPVRGHWVRLTNVWHDSCAGRGYDLAVRNVLGDMLAITAMVANNIKHDGAVAFQSVGDGPLAIGFAECRQQTKLRAIARMNEDVELNSMNEKSLQTLIGNGKVALSLIFSNGETYQGLVAMDSSDLATNVETYFATSEQLSTRIRLSRTTDTVVGCLLQRLPTQPGAPDLVVDHEEEEWQRVIRQFDRLSNDELADSSVADALSKVYSTDTIRLSRPRALQFRCTCSRSRTETALETLERTDLDELLREEGVVRITCEFCGESYDFDRAAVESVLSSRDTN